MRGPVIRPSAYAGMTYRGPVELLDLYARAALFFSAFSFSG